MQEVDLPLCHGANVTVGKLDGCRDDESLVLQTEPLPVRQLLQARAVAALDAASGVLGEVGDTVLMKAWMDVTGGLDDLTANRKLLRSC